MRNRVLFIDTETGGIDPIECSLFSIGIAVWEDGSIIFEDEIYIKDDIYRTTAQALSINNIDIIQIERNGLTMHEAIEKIKEIKKQYFNDMVMTVAGHNIAFDVSFIKQLYKNSNFSFTDDFSHRMIDTASILQFLYFSGRIEENISALDSALKYFNINVKKRHTALDDCKATAELFNNLIRLNY